MYELQMFGLGGQGAVQGAVILVDALYRDGKYAQKIPAYTGQRRGGTVSVSVKIDDKPIRSTCYIYEPDSVLILGSGLPVGEISYGLKEGGTAILNEVYGPDDVDLDVKLSKVATVDASGIWVEVTRPTSIPITNTIMLGAFSRTTGLVELESLIEAIKEVFPRFANVNIKAAKLGYERVEVKEYKGE
jgi:pyruvate ferredoxin oxidoreductase gamma subunit